MVKSGNLSGLDGLAVSESRVFVLYSTYAEAKSIFHYVDDLGLTGEKYIWIVTQSVIISERDTPLHIPIGTLGERKTEIS